MGPGVLTADERHPLISETGRRTLDALVESPDSPLWNHHCGDRLDAASLGKVRAFASTLVSDPPRWQPGQRPDWLASYMERVVRTVPRYRTAPDVTTSSFTTSRHDLARAWWQLVPDDADVAELIWFPTSGTGRGPVIVPTHPVTVSCYYPLLLEAARWHGVSVRFRPDRADWLTVVSQGQGGFTVPSWSAVLGCATAKVNLDPSGWRRDDDRRSFLERHDPKVITGDPVSLSHLADLDVEVHPDVLISTALRLTPATKERLEARFRCPVVDVYSCTESGPIAAARPAGGMALLQPRLYVEITADDGTTCPPGELGTITVTGGMNPYLPLLRYRTDDTARLVWAGDQPLLTELSGRPLVMLRSAAGTAVNSFDVTQLLEALALRRWSVHQRADTSVVVSVQPEAGSAPDLDAQVTAAIRTALGSVAVTVTPLTADDKVPPFTTDEAVT